MNGNQLLELGMLDCAFTAYQREGRSKNWIRRRIGDFCVRIGWYHTALVYYLPVDGNFKERIDKLIEELKRKKDFQTASEISRIISK